MLIPYPLHIGSLFLFAEKTCNRCESRPLFYLLLRDELALGGALNAEKKSNLLVTFASSGCFRSSNDVFTVVSSLKIFGLCTTKRNRAMIHVCTLAWLQGVTFEKGEVRSINWSQTKNSTSMSFTVLTE